VWGYGICKKQQLTINKNAKVFQNNYVDSFVMLTSIFSFLKEEKVGGF
jgi:hypothetical protein